MPIRGLNRFTAVYIILIISPACSENTENNRERNETVETYSFCAHNRRVSYRNNNNNNITVVGGKKNLHSV